MFSCLSMSYSNGVWCDGVMGEQRAIGNGLFRTQVSQWLTDNSFHALAYLALRVSSPVRAMGLMQRVASVFHPITRVSDARSVSGRLGNRGTCLSRSFAVAARVPGSVVVFGVDRESFRAVLTRPTIGAHAWVEVDELPLEVQEPRWLKVGRLA